MALVEIASLILHPTKDVNAEGRQIVLHDISCPFADLLQEESPAETFAVLAMALKDVLVLYLLERPDNV